MRHSKIPILSTRPLSPGLLQTAEQQGFQLDIVPFIKTQAIISRELKNRIHHFSSRPAVAAFTSANAAEAVIKELNGVRPIWKIFCVGKATRNAIIQYFGEESLLGSADSASALARRIVNEGNFNEIIFFCGDQRRDELPHLLSGKKIKVEEITVYRTSPVTNKVTRHYQGILFFSPSAATSFFSNNTVDKQTILFAIGETTAATLRMYSDNTIITGEEPGQENLVNAMIAYYQSKEQEKTFKRNPGK
jgi:uroporphyrinogen-III synthase